MPAVRTLTNLSRPLPEGAKAAHLRRKEHHQMELRKISVRAILSSFHNLSINKGIPGVPFSLESSQRQPSETPSGKVSIVLPD
jgi:hypothetical protein